MAKFVYNTLSVIISIALVVFCGYCMREFFIYNMSENIIYAVMSLVSVVIVMTNLIVGGKKNEKERI